MNGLGHRVTVAMWWHERLLVVPTRLPSMFNAKCSAGGVVSGVVGRWGVKGVGQATSQCGAAYKSVSPPRQTTMSTE